MASVATEEIDKTATSRPRSPALEEVAPVFSRGAEILLRVFEIVVSGVAVFVFSPLFFVVGIMVKLNSPGPVLYRGTRVGRGNTLYRLNKFRTLPVQYENDVGGRVLTQNERINGLFASIVVRSKLDELPQLINVFRGNMSFVGPRPVRPVIFSKYSKEIPGYARKFVVKPGITGLAQIVGGYYMAPVQKHKYDMLYIRNKSLFLDIKIVLLTFVVLVFSRRIMQSSLVEWFLGIKLNVRSDEIDPTDEAIKHVTGAS